MCIKYIESLDPSSMRISAESPYKDGGEEIKFDLVGHSCMKVTWNIRTSQQCLNETTALFLAH